MNYLITGNLGYIGPVLSKFLKSKNENCIITGYDNGYFLNCPIAAEMNNEKPSVDLQVFGDVRDNEKIIPYIEQADHIIHLAAISNDPMGEEFEKVTKEINQDSSIFIAREAIRGKSKSFVFASSCSVYGEGSSSPRSEIDRVNPLTAYAKSKIGTEEALKVLENKCATKITCLRFATACGYSPNIRLDLVLNDFVATALNTNSIEILSDGSPWRPLIDVEDMCRAIFWACHRENGVDNEIINIGSPSWNYQIKDLANAVKDILGQKLELKINSNAIPDKRSYRVAFDKFYDLAPFELTPQITLNESVNRMVTALLPYKERLARTERGHLIRLNILKNLKEMKILSDNLSWL